MFPPGSPLTERVRFEAETRELERRAAHYANRPARAPFRFLRRIHLPSLNFGAVTAPRVRQRAVSECE